MHCQIVVLVWSILALSVNGATLAGPTVALPRTEAIEPIESSSSIHNSPTDTNVLTESAQPTTLNSSQSNLCMTKGCVKTSAQILDLIDDNVDPCDNFYEFACGKFLRNTLIPDDKIAVMSFIHVQDKVQDQVRLVLNERSLPNESKPFTLAKILYAACMDLDTLEAQGTQPMMEILEKYGGWPVVKGNKWNEEDWNWMEINRKVSEDGLEDALVFTLSILTDQRNSSRRILDIDQPDFGLRMEFLKRGINDTNVKAYYEFMVDASVIFGANRSIAEKELLDSLQFEIELAKIAIPEGERRNQTALYNPYTLRQLQESFPYINWLNYINSALLNAITVDENEIVIVEVPDYFRQLGTILEATSNKRVLANFFAWRQILFASSLMNDAFRSRKLAYMATTVGLRKNYPRYADCVTLTIKYLPISVGALYVRKYFDEESKKEAVDLVNNVRDEFINILHDIDWMDDVTRNEAIEKAKGIISHIAYPDELTDNNKLEEYYNGLELESDQLLNNIRQIRTFKEVHAIQKLRLPVNKTDWETHTMPATVNAAYSPLENSIQLPAAILQDRFFSADRPSYMNYGAIGQIIGHEITHGFDDQGRQFDANGNLANWWLDQTQAKFTTKAECIVKQYSEYVDFDSNLRLNGVNTQGENIADNGGVKEAYRAYKNFVKRNGEEALLPGLNYTQNQLFWISTAITWCAVTRPEFDRMIITTDVHSPNEFRVIGTISNQLEFADDFKCPIGSRMNPVNKCEVWNIRTYV